MNKIHISIMFICLGITSYSCKGTKGVTSGDEMMSTKTYPTVGKIEVEDPELLTLLDADAPIQVLAGGFEFTEGPLWVESLNAVLFSDVPGDKIYSWSERDSTKLFISPGGYTGATPRGGFKGPNGLVLNSKGQLVIAQHGDRRIAIMDAPLTKPEAKFVTLASEYEGKKISSPNDLVFSKNGTLFFTDPPYGLEKSMNDPAKEIPFQGVFKMTKDGKVSLVDDGVTWPNGIAFSPDESKLYVGSSDGQKPLWMEYTMDKQLNVVSKKVFYDATPMLASKRGNPDGFKVKSSGHIFASGPGGVLVFNPAGKLLGSIAVRGVSNCAFDAKENYLYLTAGSQLLRVKMKRK